MFQAKLFLTMTIKRGYRVLVANNLVPDLWVSFCPDFLSSCWLSLNATADFIFRKFATSRLIVWDLFVARRETFYPHHEDEQFNFSKQSLFFKIHPGRKITNDSQMAQNWHFSSKMWQNLLFLPTLPATLRCNGIEFENDEFVQSANVEFIDSLKNNGTKTLLNLDDSSEEACNSKTFADIATVGRNRGLSTIYIQHNLFHQSKPGGDVDLQTTHNVLLKSPRELMKVSKLSAQLKHGSQLSDWYWDPTAVPSEVQYPSVSDWLVETSVRRITLLYKDQIRFLRILISGQAETSKLFWRRTHNVCLLSKYSNHFPTNAKCIFFIFSLKHSISFLCELHFKSSRSQPAMREGRSHSKVSKQRPMVLLSKNSQFEAEKRRWGNEKGLQLIRVMSTPVFTILSWFGAVCLLMCTTRAWIVTQLQSKNFQSIKPNKISRTKVFRSKTN